MKTPRFLFGEQAIMLPTMLGLFIAIIFMISSVAYAQFGEGAGKEEEKVFGLGGILLGKESPTLTWSSTIGVGKVHWGTGWQSRDSEILFGNIIGVTFGKDRRNLYFIGVPSNAPLRIVNLMDYFAAALRSIYAGEPPEVSIDPPFIPLNLAEYPSANMIVRLHGITENNRLGWLLFEADRTLKCLSLGQDNITRRYIRCNVPGFKSETALSLDYKVNPTAVWHRFWFEPARNHVRISLDRRTFLLDTELKVKTEYKAVQGGHLIALETASDPAAETFAKYLTENYDAFARTWIIADPTDTQLGGVNQRCAVFRELKIAAQLTSLAQAIYDLNGDNNPNNDVPIDLSWWLAEYPLGSYPTPTTTPGFTASAQRRRRLAPNKVAIQRARIFGGVSLAPKNQYMLNDTTAQGWGEAAAKRAHDYSSSPSLHFTYQGQSAALMPITLNTPRYRQTDLVTTLLKLERIYDFAQPHKKGVFGNGGSFAPNPHLYFPPYKIKLGRWGRVYPMVFLRLPGHPAIAFKLIQQALITQSRSGNYAQRILAYGGGKGLQLRFDGKFFTLISSSTHANNQTPLNLQPSSFHQGKTKTYRFKLDGRLLMEDSSQGTIRYIYENERLVQIAHSNGERIYLDYDKQGRVTLARAAECQVTYHYDEQNNLIRIADSSDHALFYVYDDQNRLIRVRDRRQDLLQIEYPANGSLPRVRLLLR